MEFLDMKKSLFMLLLAVIAGLFGCQVVGSLPPAAVVVPDNANAIEKFAAGELAEYLKKSTGRDFQIISEGKLAAGQNGYFIGRTQRAAAENVAIPEKDNSFVIKYCAGSVLICGRDGVGWESNDYNPAGTLFGVYHFLRNSLGVRWIYPGKDGEFVPQRNGFVPDKSCEYVYEPQFSDRFNNRRVKGDIRRFYRRNMFLSYSPLSKGRGGHNVWIYREYGKSDPDLFAMDVKGNRFCAPNGTFCLSNPKLHDVLFKHAVKTGSQYISGQEADNVLRCQCENCKALDGADVRGPTARYAVYPNMGERYARWYKMLLEKSRKEQHPLKVSAYAYQSFFYAPRQTKLAPEVMVGLVPDLPFPRRPEHNEFLRKEYQAWKDSGATLYLRSNYFHGGYCMPEVWYDEYADELKYLWQLGIVGVVTDGMDDMWATRGLDCYIAARLHTDPSLDAEKVFEEYISAFGKAAPEVKNYFKFFQRYMKENCARINDIYETTGRNWYFHGFNYPLYAHRIFPEKVLHSQLATLDRAAELVKDDPAALKKVEFLRAGLEHAIATVKCTKLFDSNVSGSAKAQCWKSLLAMRARLPPYVIGEKYCLNLEKRNWRVADTPRLAGTFQELPEYFAAMPDPENQGEKKGWYKVKFDDRQWKQVSTWKSLENSGYRNHLYMFYRTKFTLSEADGRNCILRLGAVDKDCKVWVNGKFAGESLFDGERNPRMWDEPRNFDISKFVVYGRENQLTVKVNSRSGAHSGIWKPSFIYFETPAKGKAVYPEFKVPKFARKSKSAGTLCLTIPGNPTGPKRLQMIKGSIPAKFVAGEKVRVRGEVNISQLAGGRVDVSLRQYNGNGKTLLFSDNIYRSNTAGWEDFSFEAEIQKDMQEMFLCLIGRNIPVKGSVSFRNIRIEKL